jgi:hypothetical protein
VISKLQTIGEVEVESHGDPRTRNFCDRVVEATTSSASDRNLRAGRWEHSSEVTGRDPRWHR